MEQVLGEHRLGEDPVSLNHFHMRSRRSVLGPQIPDRY
jgi:hypothetical protein